MKIRTCLLAAFGRVVPLIAMFSHLIPPGASDALWDATWQPASAFFAGDEDAAAENLADTPVASRSLESPADADTAQLENTTAASAAAGTAASSVVLPTVDIDTSRIADMPPAGMPPAAMSAARQPSFSAPPAELGQAAALEQPASPLWSSDPQAAASAVQPVAMATDASGATASPAAARAVPPAAQPAAAQPTGPSTALHTALEQLGAFGIDCQPTVGGRYFHCSCRIAADPTGQLVRMFHATETSPEQAMQQLLADVQQWQSQQTASTPVVPTSYGRSSLP